MEHRPQFDDETLMAFADGELADAATARSIEQAMRTDQRIAARVELFRRTAAMSKQAYAADLDTEVPASLRASVQAAIERAQASGSAENAAPIQSGGTLGTVAQASRPAANQPRYAFAASVAALVFGLLGYLMGSMTGGEPGAQLAGGFALTRDASEQGAFIEALNTLPSGQQRGLKSAGASVEMLATVRDRAGSLCREFKLVRGSDATLGVACRAAQQWAVSFAATSPPGETGYAPASSTPALDAYLSAIEAGPPLSAEEERAALAREQ